MAEIIVYNFGQLKAALTDTTSTVIYLGDNIIFNQTGGIVVPRTKGDIRIDGQGFSITDYSSVSSGDTIRIADTSQAITFTIYNTVWSGRNFYGVTYCPTGSNGSVVNLVLNKVRYIGPQPIYNLRGVTKIIDSDFRLVINTGTTSPQEFMQANRVIISGNVTVDSYAESDAVIWFTNSSPSLTIEANAVFNVTAHNSYMFYIDGQTPAVSLGENSITSISTKTGLFRTTSSTTQSVSSFVMERGASFTASQEQRYLTVPAFKCINTFKMDEGSSFYLAFKDQGSSPLIYFGSTAHITFNKPKNVVLYNKGGNVFSFETGTVASPNVIDIDAELVNIWTHAVPFPQAGTIDDPPSGSFSKEGYGGNITARIAATRTTITDITTNVLAGDTGYPMNAVTFNIFQAEVISVGSLSLSVDSVRDISNAIKGNTEPSASLKAAYNDNVLKGEADGEGAINLELPESIAAGTALSFSANRKFLTKTIKLIVDGSVRITHAADLVFKSFTTPPRISTVKRADANWYIEVTDTRISGAQWYLYACAAHPMSSETDVLENALVYALGTYINPMSDVPTLIRIGQWAPPPAVTHISWDELEGLLLRVNPTFPYNAGKYSTEIRWEVKESPII